MVEFSYLLHLLLGQTPSDYDVHALLGHVVSVLHKLTRLHPRVHRPWDLAHATRRLTGLDPVLAAQALETFSKFAPPEACSE
ncbi:hypothetical protein [Streptomyces atratus]|uniref:hypothetical protein n=1 Tax=Streptomyces atratus TaxID=1893 RepID=UPI0021A519D9|nr:hypothetical protein [Streptomyces atratus]MCT2546823.1 hypothetical protein [Streptomyces atratus]